MLEPWRLTNLWASKACYRDSFTFYLTISFYSSPFLTTPSIASVVLTLLPLLHHPSSILSYSFYSFLISLLHILTITIFVQVIKGLSNLLATNHSPYRCAILLDVPLCQHQICSTSQRTLDPCLWRHALYWWCIQAQQSHLSERRRR
jgi:hypothetical protein